VGPTQELVRRRGSFERHRDDLEDGLLSALVARRWVESDGHEKALPSYPATTPGQFTKTPMTFDPVTDWITPLWGQRIPLCPFVKITQLLGEVRCYLLPDHDGAHCSADWMEWI